MSSDARSLGMAAKFTQTFNRTKKTFTFFFFKSRLSSLKRAFTLRQHRPGETEMHRVRGIRSTYSKTAEHPLAFDPSQLARTIFFHFGPRSRVPRMSGGQIRDSLRRSLGRREQNKTTGSNRRRSTYLPLSTWLIDWWGDCYPKSTLTPSARRISPSRYYHRRTIAAFLRCSSRHRERVPDQRSYIYMYNSLVAVWRLIEKKTADDDIDLFSMPVKNTSRKMWPELGINEEKVSSLFKFTTVILESKSLIGHSF